MKTKEIIEKAQGLTKTRINKGNDLRLKDVAERRRRAEILSARFEEATKTTVPRGNRRPVEELEVLFNRRSRARLLK